MGRILVGRIYREPNPCFSYIYTFVNVACLWFFTCQMYLFMLGLELKNCISLYLLSISIRKGLMKYISKSC